MLSPKLKEIIKQKADEFGIDYNLVLSFCIVESSGNPRATRYEANFYKKYIVPLNLPSPEGTKRATSWGLMQIMGQVAREKGFKGKFEELFDPAVNLFWSLKHLKHFIKQYAPNLDDAIVSYNAGSPRHKQDGTYVNQVYVDKIHKYLQSIKSVVT